MTYDAPAVITDLIELGGAGLHVVELGRESSRPPAGVVLLGVHRAGDIPVAGLDAFDILLSCDRDAPGPWVGVGQESLDVVIEALRTRAAAQPAASTVAAQVFRMTLDVGFDKALTLESLAYSTLLASGRFRVWRDATPVRSRVVDQPRVLMFQESDGLHIRLNRSATRNAFDPRMRDELVEALSFALDHPDRPYVILSGEGPAFSAGGDLDTFGQASDVGEAHLIRTLRSPARLVRELGDRITVCLHGACVGAGIEVPAASARITARPGTHFRLPEVSMGLIPGAGGTATIARRIGRQRACYMALLGDTIDLETAMAWGLVDEVIA